MIGEPRRHGTWQTTRNSRGLTLIELMLALAIVGIIATLGIVSYNNYIRSSKEHEARLALKQFGDLALSYFHATHELDDGNGGSVVMHQRYPVDNRCSAGGNEGGRTSPRDTDWSAGAWGDLGFVMRKPHYYQYCYESSADGASFVMLAQARLANQDFDSRFVLFALPSAEPDIRLVELEPGAAAPAP